MVKEVHLTLASGEVRRWREEVRMYEPTELDALMGARGPTVVGPRWHLEAPRPRRQGVQRLWPNACWAAESMAPNAANVHCVANAERASLRISSQLDDRPMR